MKRTNFLLFLVICFLFSCGTEEEVTPLDPFLDNWYAAKHTWEDCIEDGVDNSIDTGVLCTCKTGIAKFHRVIIQPTGLIEFHRLDLIHNVIDEYPFVLDMATNSILIEDESGLYEKALKTDIGLELTGLKDGCESSYILRRY